MMLHAGERSAFILYHEGGDGHLPAPIDNGYAALQETIDFWRAWSIGTCAYRGRYYDSVIRSALTLKLLTYAPTGAIVAAPTTSLPEEIGGERNWDYRFTWIRDASFTLYALLLAGYIGEDDAFFEWIVRTVEVEETGIKILYPISPEGEVTERTLDHLEGYRGSRPVRIGNEAAEQVQLDVYGEVLDALYFACEVSGYDPAPVWDDFLPLVHWIAENWNQPGNGIWEVRGGLRDFVYGKALCWVALDRGIRLAEARGLDVDTERWRREHDRIRAGRGPVRARRGDRRGRSQHRQKTKRREERLRGSLRIDPKHFNEKLTSSRRSSPARLSTLSKEGLEETFGLRRLSGEVVWRHTLLPSTLAGDSSLRCAAEKSLPAARKEV
jgi:GH15 family glucan-1,4-alpha-glucosidase